MKALTVKIGGTATPGDVLQISYFHKGKGGHAGLTYKVRPPTDEIVTDPETGAKSVKTCTETPATMAQGLLDEFRRGQQWPNSEFDMRIDPAAPDTLNIKAKETYEFDGMSYSVEVHGLDPKTPATETMTLSVF